MSNQHPSTRPVISLHRLLLLATVTSFGAAALIIGPSGSQLNLPAFSRANAAEAGQRPAGFADLVEKVKPAVISVRVKTDAGATVAGFERDRQQPPPDSGMDRFFRQFGMPFGGSTPDGSARPNNRSMASQGSGFFITADGYAVTNNHVVDKAQAMEVKTDDGKTYSAKVVGSDPRSDIALIKVDGRNDFPHVNIADKAPRIGEWVVAIGNPFGLGGTVTAGIVSARGRDIGAGPYDDFIQIDAPVNKGNSGGPTFDMDGNVIGVNTAIFSPSGGSVGIAFDVPAETVKAVVAQLKDKGVVTRGWIGVQAQSVTAEIAESLDMRGSEGALVADSQANSPAVKAGILSGDVITAINGNPVKDARDLARQIGAMTSGSTATLTVWRKGAEKTFSVTLGELPKERDARAGASDPGTASADQPKLGLTLAPAQDVAGSGSEGVVVTDVDPNGLASEHGFKTGDVILEVGGKRVTNAADVRDAIGEAHKNGKRTVLMRVKSDGVTTFVAVPIAQA